MIITSLCFQRQGDKASWHSKSEIILEHLELIWFGLTHVQDIWLAGKSSRSETETCREFS